MAHDNVFNDTILYMPGTKKSKKVETYFLIILSLHSLVAGAADVHGFLTKNKKDLPAELQQKLDNKTPVEQREIIESHFLGASKVLNSVGVGLHSTKIAHRLGSDHDDQFSPERRELHEKIIHEFLGDLNEKKPTPGTRPKLVLTAGSPGAGKSTVLTALNKYKILDSNDYVYIDIDEIRAKLPEYSKWINDLGKGANSEVLEKASQLTQAEASYLCEEIHSRAIKMRKNIIRDGTLRNTLFFSNLISNANLEGYGTGIVHIRVSRETANARVEARANETGRRINKEFLEASSPEVINLSANLLRNLTEFYIEIDNETDPKVVNCIVNSICYSANTTEFEAKYSRLGKTLTQEMVREILLKLPCKPESQKSNLPQFLEKKDKAGVFLDRLKDFSELKRCMEQLNTHTDSDCKLVEKTTSSGRCDENSNPNPLRLEKTGFESIIESLYKWTGTGKKHPSRP